MRLQRLIISFLSGLLLRCGAAEISFNRDIRPVLAEACFECHGPAKAKAGLRLDSAIFATNVLKSGATAIVPNHPSKSEALRRVKTTDVENRMPPAETGKPPLSEKQIAALEQWIVQGAHWEEHWAFGKIRRPRVPTPADPEAVDNPIDAFIQAGLLVEGLQPGPPASRRILERRLAFDLTGLPPRDFSEGATWNEMIDAYLASPAFGERMAVWWLDLVRYADSEGYFSDSHRNVFPYRDYVIRSFNANKPFDRFTHEQIAGDLLPGAGLEQKIASGYNRLILTTHEDGANAAEYRARYAADRVRNLGSVWLGLTLGCAQCHDHKFDPITAGDFYRTAAFFADIREEAVLAQREIFTVTNAPEYEAMVERCAWIESALLRSSEVQCEQTRATDEFLATGNAPEYFPKSRRTREILELIRNQAAGRSTPAERTEVSLYFRRHLHRIWNAELTKLKAARQRYETNAEPTLVAETGPVRTVRLLARGNWMDTVSPEVSPNYLHFLPQPPPGDERLTRLDLARWITAPENPLTARVAVNRLWQLFFGAGLSRNLDDFGLQGEAPSNPELLDWLAAEFVDSGWDIKHIVRLIVESRAYRQSSSSPDGKDPSNHLFARQNRFPLPAEFVRDNALALAGLLSGAVGGPPVKPYIPNGFLDVVDTLREEPYQADVGERLYRRGVYLYRKRTFLHPVLAAFNASNREECVSQRAQSATPRQSLALLNSPVFVEAARALAERMFNAGQCDADRIKAGFQWCLRRPPSEQECAFLEKLLQEQRKSFSADAPSAARYIRNGNYRWAPNLEAADLAAWTDVARALLNLEETNTRY